LFRIGPAADIEEIRGAATRVFDDVHGGHGETRAIHHAGDVAIELDVVQTEFRCFDFERIFFVEIAKLEDVLVAEQRVVVEIDFGVKRVDLVVLRENEWIDFGERSIHFKTGFGERHHGGYRAVDCGGGNADAERQIARLIRHQAKPGLDKFFEDGVGSVGGNFFDFHAAGRGCHEDDLARRAIEHNAEVEFLFDRQRLFDEQPPDQTSFRAGLVGDQSHSENFFGDRRRFRGILRDFNATAFTASAGVNLRFHDDASADIFCGGLGLGNGESNLAARHGDFEFGQNRLGLILVNFH
jgi:hypothetical protein